MVGDWGGLRFAFAPVVACRGGAGFRIVLRTDGLGALREPVVVGTARPRLAVAKVADSLKSPAQWPSFRVGLRKEHSSGSPARITQKKRRL